MADLTIKTNNHWRNIQFGYELTDEQRAEFDWIDPHEIDHRMFVTYKGHVYSLDEFMRLEGEHHPFGQWDGYASDSFFSGVLVKISDDGEQVKLATYLS